MPFFEFIPSVTIILFPLILVLLLALILGVSYILSIVYIYAKDVQPLWAVIIHALFFLNPIFWYLDDTSGIALEFQKINPLGQIIEFGHQIVFGNIPPINDWLYTTSIVIGILVTGYLIFHKFEKNAMEQM
jgi:lipopolysaccharide transport system permease protein